MTVICGILAVVALAEDFDNSRDPQARRYVYDLLTAVVFVLVAIVAGAFLVYVFLHDTRLLYDLKYVAVAAAAIAAIVVGTSAKRSLRRMRATQP